MAFLQIFHYPLLPLCLPLVLLVDMPGDHDLDLRGRLIRSLGTLREMLPGSFVERPRKCGKPNCRCADGKQLHSEFQVSVLLEGKLKTFHIPAELAEEARSKVEMHKR